MDFMEIIAWGLTALFGTVGATYWKKIQKVIKVLKELADVVYEIDKASKDGKWTAEEIKVIRKEINELLAIAGIKRQI